MVMMAQPLALAIEHARSQIGVGRTVLLTPRGRPLEQGRVRSLVESGDLVLVCGRYEGIDERVVAAGLIDEEVSLGDFVLNGGETAALAVIEACARLVPGVVGKAESVEQDSFSCGLLDHPHYTRPRVFRGLQVPVVLLSGNHAEIERWRRRMALVATRDRRPDLLEKAGLTDDDRELLEE